jgi:SMI1-KNR4 cell-wall
MRMNISGSRRCRGRCSIRCPRHAAPCSSNTSLPTTTVTRLTDTIWRVPAYLPYLQPPLTDDAIAAAESTIGFRLPVEYLALLRQQNGGYIRLSLPDMVHDTIAGIGPHFPSLTDFSWDDVQHCVSFPLQGLVPFDGDGHWHLCLDYRANATQPSVTYIDIEVDDQTPVAATFAEYLALLRVDAGDAYVLDSIADVGLIIAQLSAALNVPFAPADSWDHGYPIHRASLGTTDTPEWLWLSANRAPRGFVRADDPRYDELRTLLPGEALRYPELPPDSVLLSATDGVRDTVVHACAALQIPVARQQTYFTP